MDNKIKKEDFESYGIFLDTPIYYYGFAKETLKLKDNDLIVYSTIFFAIHKLFTKTECFTYYENEGKNLIYWFKNKITIKTNLYDDVRKSLKRLVKKGCLIEEITTIKNKTTNTKKHDFYINFDKIIELTIKQEMKNGLIIEGEKNEFSR